MDRVDVISNLEKMVSERNDLSELECEVLSSAASLLYDDTVINVLDSEGNLIVTVDGETAEFLTKNALEAYIVKLVKEGI